MAFDDSIKRFERIVAILIQLQSKRVVKAQELADHFSISLRTVYRDIRALEAAGVPIYAEAGIGYSLTEGYKLPPVMFTEEEAATFIAAEQLMLKYMDEHLGRHFLTAMAKIKAVLKEDQKDQLATIQPNLKVMPTRRLFNKNVPDVLEIFLESISRKKQVIIKYQALNADQPSDRQIEPVGLLQANSHWYLLAFCHLRKDYRNFRTDRIFGIRRTEFDFEVPHQPLDYYLKKDRHPNRKKIRISVDKVVARYMKWERDSFGFVSEETKGDRVEMVFETDYEINLFERWFMMFADSADILEPLDLKRRVQTLLSEMVDRQHSPLPK